MATAGTIFLDKKEGAKLKLLIMGNNANDIIDGLCDSFGDYTYKDNVNHQVSYKDTPAECNIRKVRKELAILIKQNEKDLIINPVASARKTINLKYGKDWRERGLVANSPNQWKSLSEY